MAFIPVEPALLLQASRKVQAGEVRPSDLTEACFEQMERSSWLNCFVTRCLESARSQAEAADARQANGERRLPDDMTEKGRDGFMVPVRDNAVFGVAM